MWWFAMDRQHEDRLWWLLLGAMLGNSGVKADAQKRLSREEVPVQFQPLWDAMRKNDPALMVPALETLGIPKCQEETGIVKGWVRTLAQRAMTEYIRAVGTKLSTGYPGVDADHVLNVLDLMRSKIEAKKATLEQP